MLALHSFFNLCFPERSKFINNFYRNQRVRVQKPVEYVNEFVPDRTILLISETGQNLGVMSKRDALKKAVEAELDLVLVSDVKAEKLVCKIMNYSKYKYDKLKREKEQKKNQTIIEIKEIRLSPVIDVNDINTKLKHARRFFKAGNKVKISMRFRGRMIQRIELGMEVMQKFIQELGEECVVEAQPKMDKRSLIATIAPAKKENK